jgi:hypothetical protein
LSRRPQDRLIGGGIIRHRDRGTTNKAVAFSALFSAAILKAGF